MTPTPRGSTPSYSATVVLQALAQGAAYGFDVMRAAGLPSGTVYPLLRRLEAGGLVSSRWEDQGEADGQGRPRRRYYEITADGQETLRRGLERLRAQRGLLDAPLAGDETAPVTE